MKISNFVQLFPRRQAALVAAVAAEVERVSALHERLVALPAATALRIIATCGGAWDRVALALDAAEHLPQPEQAAASGRMSPEARTAAPGGSTECAFRSSGMPKGGWDALRVVSRARPRAHPQNLRAKIVAGSPSSLPRGRRPQWPKRFSSLVVSVDAAAGVASPSARHSSAPLDAVVTPATASGGAPLTSSSSVQAAFAARDARHRDDTVDDASLNVPFISARPPLAPSLRPRELLHLRSHCPVVCAVRPTAAEWTAWEAMLGNLAAIATEQLRECRDASATDDGARLQAAAETVHDAAEALGASNLAARASELRDAAAAERRWQWDVQTARVAAEVECVSASVG